MKRLYKKANEDYTQQYINWIKNIYKTNKDLIFSDIRENILTILMNTSDDVLENTIRELLKHDEYHLRKLSITMKYGQDIEDDIKFICLMTDLSYNDFKSISTFEEAENFLNKLNNSLMKEIKKEIVSPMYASRYKDFLDKLIDRKSLINDWINTKGLEYFCNEMNLNMTDIDINFDAIENIVRDIIVNTTAKYYRSREINEFLNSYIVTIQEETKEEIINIVKSILDERIKNMKKQNNRILNRMYKDAKIEL